MYLYLTVSISIFFYGVTKDVSSSAQDGINLSIVKRCINTSTFRAP